MGNANHPVWSATAGHPVVPSDSLHLVKPVRFVRPREVPVTFPHPGERDDAEKAALRRRAHAMELLFSLGTASERHDSLTALLDDALCTLMRATGAVAGVVRRLDDQGALQLVAARGMEGDLLDGISHPVSVGCGVSAEHCACGEAARRGCLISSPELANCRQAHPQHQGRSLHLLAVPLTADERKMGVFSLFLPPERLHRWQQLDLHEMLRRAGEHLGLAMARIMRESEARVRSLQQERSQITHELHDCLAQRLAALGLEVRNLEAAGAEGRPHSVRSGLRHVRRGLDQAHRELRQLMSQFRITLERGGLEPALRRLVLRFQRDTGVRALLSHHWPRGGLSPDQEFQVLRIAQEALNNVRNHSGARHVQVALQQRRDGLQLIIEDDGRGFDVASARGEGDDAGHHLGLGVMRARADAIGGRLAVMSEPGEGVRLEMTLPGRNGPAGEG